MQGSNRINVTAKTYLPTTQWPNWTTIIYVYYHKSSSYSVKNCDLNNEVCDKIIKIMEFSCKVSVATANVIVITA